MRITIFHHKTVVTQNGYTSIIIILWRRLLRVSYIYDQEKYLTIKNTFTIISVAGEQQM